MTVHVISVGVSILDALKDPRKHLTDLSLRSAVLAVKPWDLLAANGVADDSGAASVWLAGALAAHGDPGRGSDAADSLAGLCASMHPERWPGGLSAELDTLARAPDAGLPLREADIALLICSDTPAGLIAGLWNAAVLASGNLHRVRYLATPHDQIRNVRRCAVIARIPGLDAGDEAGFRQAMQGLGVLGRGMLDQAGVGPAEPFSFHLSGGFKAAIPYLLGIAEGLRSLAPKRPVEAYVLHDTAKERPLIRLPLRRLDAWQVQEELSGFDETGTRRGLPKPAMLKGYAYEAEGKDCRLTAFGEGLRTLFGLPEERFRR